MKVHNQNIDVTDLFGSLESLADTIAATLATKETILKQFDAKPAVTDPDTGAVTQEPIGGSYALLDLCKSAAKLLDDIEKFGVVSSGEQSGPPYA
jgi:hypothetical protein